MNDIEYWDLTSDPTGDTYRALIQSLCTHSDSFYFITRQELPYNQEILREFDPWIFKRYKTKNWANTATLGPPATVYQMEANKQTCLLLQQSAQSLYDWISPVLPEDLTFIKNGFTWFSSTTHEEMAEFVIRSECYRNIIKSIPGLQVKRTE
ncbi:hypothetical protein [Rossellomorea vietnamensis]|uniref:hypothetical protein n=1 Tax=Rossellomorea vietnamensis TaxID=218284 RepID=UPI001E4382FF|nr:hypothetical protein [Rossellomorea vietnamensis]MCC5803639.1 hypothetical protein [Rossellomorea vietnamensis]